MGQYMPKTVSCAMSWPPPKKLKWVDYSRTVKNPPQCEPPYKEMVYSQPPTFVSSNNYAEIAL